MRKRFPKVQASKIEAFTHNSKVSANEPDWGSVDKTKLPRPAFADQGEAGQVSTWGFPHHWVQNGAGSDADGRYTTGTMLLSKGGLNAAWSAAQGGRSGQKASPEVISHLEGHRRALNLSALPSGVNAVAFTCTPKFIEAAAGAEGAAARPKFQMLAYTGGAMNLRGWDLPVVVDLAGVRIHSQQIPIRRGHDAMLLVGHTTSVKAENGQIEAEGVISFDTPAAQEVVSGAKNGFPWQASIGADPTSVEFIGEGEQATVNGAAHQGPLYVVRASDLNEISFVDLGADRNTVAKVAAHRKPQEEEQHMNEEQKKALKAALAALKAGKIEAALKAIEAHEACDHEDFVALREDIEAAKVEAAKVAAASDPVLAHRAAIAAEDRRIVDVTKAAGEHAKIRAEAIEKGWSVAETELKVMRAERATAPAIAKGQEPVDSKVLECALAVSGGMPGVEKAYEDKVLQAAHSRFKGRIGLQEAMMEAAWARGYTGRSFRSDPRGIMEAAFKVDAAQFSTMSLPGIFSNVVNKFLLMGFDSVEATWRAISAIGNVKDFKQISSFRLADGMEYEEVGPGGELKHGELDEVAYTNQAKTWGKMFAITRQDVINDDLGAMTKIPLRLGRGAALKLNKVFWTEFLDDAAFFTAGNNNLLTGGPSALSVDGLTVGETAFLDQVDPKGNPLGALPRILLVGNALNVTGTRLMQATNVVGPADEATPATNPHAGKFTVVRSSYLNNPQIPGGSETAWWLLASPLDLAVIETVFLNGQQTPIVESADADFNTLGIQFRGYHDFGVKKQEFRGGVKSEGV